ncbi:MAG: hypothetical protein HY675_00665 [Chloroflexi bacterium]|nr:hypothetical protein [Chloroflexota bacterium]
MTTAAQIDANRRNAQKSTGPSTPEGKARVALNALKHGIRASTLVASLQRTPIFDEDPQDFVDLLQSLLDYFHPEGPIEQAYVEDIAVCRWRLARIISVETGSIASAQHILLSGPGADNPRLHARNRLPDLATLEKLDRYENSLQRQIRRSLDALTTLIRQRSSSRTGSPSNPLPAQQAARSFSTAVQRDDDGLASIRHEILGHLLAELASTADPESRSAAPQPNHTSASPNPTDEHPPAKQNDTKQTQISANRPEAVALAPLSQPYPGASYPSPQTNPNISQPGCPAHLSAARGWPKTARGGQIAQKPTNSILNLDKLLQPVNLCITVHQT